MQKSAPDRRKSRFRNSIELQRSGPNRMQIFIGAHQTDRKGSLETKRGLVS